MICGKPCVALALLLTAAVLSGCSDDFAATAGARESGTAAASNNGKLADGSAGGGEVIRRPPPDGHSSASWHQLREVDPQEQLISPAPTSGSRAFDFDGLTVWPVDQVPVAQGAVVDRSAQYPPLFAAGADAAADEPQRAGAVPPAAALKEAEGWIRRVIKDEYVPVTLAVRLHAVAHVRPEYSTVWVRYEMGNVAVQVGQTRGAMVIVLRSKTYVGERTAEFGREAFRRFFADQALARAEMQPASSASADLAMFNIIGRGSAWFDRARWYTDGQAMAVWLPKRLPGQQAVEADAPWF